MYKALKKELLFILRQPKSSQELVPARKYSPQAAGPLFLEVTK